jgi:hypothetical protein
VDSDVRGGDASADAEVKSAETGKGEPMSAIEPSSVKSLHPRSAAVMTAAAFLASSPHGSWRQRVDVALADGAPPLGKAARLLRRLRALGVG